MKKILTAFLFTTFSASLFAGGLVTNTNQSALFTRLQSRNGSIAPDAVYYNPAGLTRLGSGLHLSISNQVIKQTRTITTDYPYLHNKKYVGDVFAPIFPGIYASYNLKKFAFSFGFNPVGGGGGAKFDDGLPMIEMSPSDLVPAFASKGVSDYRLSEYFEGKSVFFGYQAGVSYKINDIVSVYAGVRYVTAKNTYAGHLSGIELYNFGASGTWTRADAIMTGIATSASTAAVSTTGIVNAGYGGLTLAQCVTNSIISQAQADALSAGLTALGGTPTASTTVSTYNTSFLTYAAKFNASAVLLGDQAADVTQTGSGIAPIIGVNISLSDKLNIGLKYEFKTPLTVTNDTKSDFITGFTGTGTPITMFPDGAKTIQDMPAMLAGGFEFRPFGKLMITGSANYYFDKNVDYDGSESIDINQIDKNFKEFGLGVEYGLTSNLRASLGWLGTYTGVNSDYNSELRYSTSTNTIGGGFGYKVTNMIDINLGASYTVYQSTNKAYQHNFAGSGLMLNVNDKLEKNTLIFALGVDLNF
jgi:long-chain fatty acid transport protein